MERELKELLKHESGEILKTPLLLMLMLRLYSQIFLHSEPCSTCEKKHQGYINRLQKDGLNQIKKNKIMITEKKYKLIEGVILHTPEGLFSEANITDKVSERLCAKYPALRGNYKIAPALVEKKAEKVEAPIEEVEKKEEVKEIPKSVEKKQTPKAKK